MIDRAIDSPRDIVFASSFVALTEWPSPAQAVRTAGYHGPNDGGGGLWLLSDPPTDPSAPGYRKLGEQWCRLLIEQPLDPRCLGARGDGASDDTVVLQEAIAIAGSIQFSPGTYPVKNLRITRPLSITGCRGVTLVPSDIDDRTDQNCLIRVESDHCTIEHLSFRGVVSKIYGERPAPFSFILASRLAPEFEGRRPKDDGQPIKFHRANSLRIAHCDFVGGQRACFVTTYDDVVLDDLCVVDTYEYGVTAGAGSRRLLITRTRVSGCGINEGIKVGYRGSPEPAEEIIISDFVVRDCGWLEPDVRSRQEGVDLFLGAARKVVIANGAIDNCAGGGLELKRRRTPLQPDTFEHIVISNLIIRNTAAKKGIVLNWSTPRIDTLNAPNSSGRVLISGCRIDFELSDGEVSTEATGVSIVGWSDVVLQGLAIRGAIAGVTVSASIEDGQAARNVSIIGCDISEAMLGIYLSAGHLQSITIASSIVRAWSAALVVSATAMHDLRIFASQFVQSRGARENARCTAIDVRRVSGLKITNCEIEADQYGLFSLPASLPDSRGHEVVGSVFRLDGENGRGYVRLDDDGRWLISGNRFLGCARAKDVIMNGSAKLHDPEDGAR